MKKLLLLLFCSSGLFAGSLRLYNDSAYKLRAVIRAADGTMVGEMIILPDHYNTWSDQYPSFGPGGQQYGGNSSQSMTPYLVHWHCLDGELYGVCPNLATGAAVTAQGCEGPRYCKPPKKKKKSPYGAHEDDEQLYKTQPQSNASDS